MITHLGQGNANYAIPWLPSWSYHVSTLQFRLSVLKTVQRFTM